MTHPTPATSTLSIMDRAKSHSDTAYCILLAIQGIADAIAERDLREIKIRFHYSGQSVEIEVKR